MFASLCLLLASALWSWTTHAQNLSSEKASAANTASNTCQQLRRTLGASIVQSRSSGPEYSIGANAAWSAFNHETNFQPTCIVFVNSTKHVQTTMEAIFHTDADYSVQSGGHSAMTGWNTIEDGVLISFKNMNATSYDPDSDTITILPGIRWGDASSILATFGVAPVGGRIGDVGTALLLGGGISYLSPSEGYASDNYVSLDVVLVNGSLVTATTDNEYADLFKALKGGGNRFGIVTRYEVKAVHTGTEQDKPWWGGTFVYPNSSSEALLNAIAHFAYDTNDTNAVLATEIFTFWGPSGVDLSIQVEMLYNGSISSFNKTFAEFLSIPYTSSSVSSLSYLDMVDAVHFPEGLGNLFAGSVLAGVSANSDFPFDDYLETYRSYNNFTTTFASSPDLNYTLLSFTPVLQSQIRTSYEKGGNPMSPPLEQGGFTEVLFQVGFQSHVTLPPQEIEQGRQFWMDNSPRTPGLPLFLNEVDASQQALATYGGYEFLKEVYAKYDPTSFNIRHTQGPLGLSN